MRGLQPVGRNNSFDQVVPRLQGMVNLRRQWPSIMGPTLSQKIFPLKISNGVLTVRTPHNGWAHQLTMMQQEILTKVQTHTGIALEKIKWQVAPLPSLDPTPPKAPGQKCATTHRTQTDDQTSVKEVIDRVRRLHANLMD